MDDDRNDLSINCSIIVPIYSSRYIYVYWTTDILEEGEYRITIRVERGSYRGWEPEN